MADPETPDGASPTRATHAPDRRLVLVADRTDGVDDLANALRADGISVVSCDVVALPERAARMDPFAVVVDLEQPNAAPALARLLEQPERTMAIAAVGTVELGRRLRLAAAERARLFTRPLAPSAIVGFLRDIARLDGLLPKAPPSSAGSGPGTGAFDSDSLLVSEFPAIAGMPEVEGILPELDGGPISTQIASTLSREIEQLLETSARRVLELDEERSPSGADANILVPPEMLAMVDDLLSSDEPPATRGGMDLAAMFSGALPDGASSEEGAFFDPPPHDSQPSWITGVPDPERSEEDARPSSRASDEGEGESTGFGAHESDRQSEVPGTAIGVSEETSVPGAGTQVGHSSPVEPLPAPLPTPPETPFHRPRSSHPLDEVRRSGVRDTTSDGPPSSSRGRRRPSSLAPPRTEAYAASRPGGPVQLGSDGPPASSLSVQRFSQLGVPSDPPLTNPTVRLSNAPVPRESELGLTVPRAEPSDTGPESREVVEGDPFEMLANAVRRRFTGALVLRSVDGKSMRRILLRDGDMVNAASDNEEDALVQFLVERGDLRPEVLQMRSARLPHTGRHAAAALIANGFLGQDDLWPVLRSHAEWIIARALLELPTLGHVEREPPDRLRAEPNVFGGAAGVEVFIESARRVLSAEQALERLGGPQALLGEGPSTALLAESALTPDELDRVHTAVGRHVSTIIDDEGAGFEAVVFALVTLGILSVQAPSRRPSPSPQQATDPLDADAIRQRVRARMALVEEADYFALLGLTPLATGYDIRRAFLELRRAFDPSRLLTAATADLQDDVSVIVEVLEEAYQILRDPQRRNRYQRALSATGPSPRQG